MATSVNFPCAVCASRLHITPCATCGSAMYCSEECKAKDSELHEIFCSSFKKIESEAPSRAHLLALYLPVDSPAPQLKWILKSEINKILGCREDEYSESLYMRLNRSFGHNIVGLLRPKFLDDGSNFNACLVNITGGDYHYPWKGGIICLGSSNNDYYRSVSLNDIRAIVEYFKWYGLGTYNDETWGELKFTKVGQLWEATFRKSAEEEVKGVLILCRGEQKLLGGRKYIEIEIPKHHHIFQSKPTPISEHMGLPILICKAAPDLTKLDGYAYSMANQSATYLTLKGDPTDEGFGWAPIPLWTNSVGNVLMVRKDRKPLTANQAEAISRFCQYVISETITDGREAIAEECEAEERMGYVNAPINMNQKIVDRVMTQDEFEKFFKDHSHLRTQRGTFEEEGWEVEMEADPSWATATSPYSV